MTSDNKDKLILITGAGGGIGCALADHLLSEGYTNVACQYKTRSVELEKVITSHDLKFWETCRSADLQFETDVENLRAWIEKLPTPLWAIINLAGSSSNAMSWKISLDSFEDILNSNLKSTFLMCREFIPGMRARQGGRIINTSSVIASSGTIGASHYCAAKGAIESYTRAIALELAPKNITVNAMALGYFDKGLIEHVDQETQAKVLSKTPLNRFGNVKEIAGLLRFLLSDDSAFMTGQIVHMNGGFHL